MPPMISLVLALLGLALCIWFIARRDRQRREAPGACGTSVFRTDWPLDDCMDALARHEETDLFSYTLRRDPDGSFLLHFTRHNPTAQPLDTLYQLRLDPGRRTTVTLIFLREAFGYKEPVFPAAMLNEFVKQKLDADPVELNL